jgi:hypothetical protein
VYVEILLRKKGKKKKETVGEKRCRDVIRTPSKRRRRRRSSLGDIRQELDE